MSTMLLLIMVVAAFTLDGSLSLPYNYESGNVLCHYKGRSYSEGESIRTDQPCLNCSCDLHGLICYLRVCIPVPDPPPPGCIIIHRKSQCCAQLKCYSNVADELTSNNVESRSPGKLDIEGEGLTLDDYSELSNITKNGCVFNGTRYGEGSALPSSSECEYCFCMRSQQTCVRPDCKLHLPACQPIYSKHACCPVKYNCSKSSNIRIVAAIPSTQLPYIKAKEPPKNSSYVNGNTLINETLPSPLPVRNPITERSSTRSDVSNDQRHYGNTFQSTRKNHHTKTTFSPSINPTPRRAHKSTNSFSANRLSTPAITTFKGKLPSSYPTTSATSETTRGLIGNKMTTPGKMSTSASERTTLTSRSTTRPTTSKDSSTKTSLQQMKNKLGNNSKPSKINTSTTMKLDRVNNFNNTKKVTTSKPFGYSSNKPAEPDTKPFISNMKTNLSNLSSINETYATENQFSKTDLTTPKNLNDTESKEIENITNSNISGTTLKNLEISSFPKNQISLDSQILVTTTAVAVLNEVDIPKTATNITTNGIVENNKNLTDNVETLTYRVQDDKIREPVGEHRNKGSILSTVVERLSTAKVTHKSQPNDYELDYDEPTLPPSLPNLKIIPFVAADAVDEHEEEVAENRADLLMTSDADSGLLQSVDYVISPQLGSNNFSPPIETEGGFVPRDSILDGPYFESKYSDVYHTTQNIVAFPNPSNSKMPSSSTTTVATNVIINGKCSTVTKIYQHGELISDSDSCETCFCLFSEIVCQPFKCPIASDNCYRSNETDQQTPCCNKIICNSDIERITSSPNVKSTESKTSKPANIINFSSLVNSGYASINIHRDLTTSTTTKKQPTTSEKTPASSEITANNSVSIAFPTIESETTKSNLYTTKSNRYTTKSYSDYDEADDSFSLKDVFSLFFDEPATTASTQRLTTTLRPKTTHYSLSSEKNKTYDFSDVIAFENKPKLATKYWNTMRLATTPSQITMDNDRSTTIYDQGTTTNDRNTDRSTTTNDRSTIKNDPITTTTISPKIIPKTTATHVDSSLIKNDPDTISSKPIRKVDSENGSPVKKDELVYKKFSKVPESSTTKIKTYSPIFKGDIGGSIGLLKLSGCNIFGRMYRVGSSIVELSGPCLRCMCTDIGVKCSPIEC